MNSGAQHYPNSSDVEKTSMDRHHEVHHETAHAAAKRDHTSPLDLEITSSRVIRYGHALIELDPKAEARLLLKIDVYCTSP